MPIELNSSVFQAIIAESIQNILFEENIKDPINFGNKGAFKGIPCSELEKEIPSDILAHIDSGRRDLTMTDIQQNLSATTVYKMYVQYKAAIESNPNASAIGFFLFLSRLRKGFHGLPMTYFEDNGNYIIGANSAGQWLAAYFAPESMKGGAFAIRHICEYDNIVFAVTDNLSPMLLKLNVPHLSEKIDCKFRGSKHQKDIFGSTMHAAEVGAKIVGMTNLDMKSVINGDPKAIDFLRNNPDMIAEVIANPQIQSALASNPNVLNGIVAANPQVAQTLSKFGLPATILLKHPKIIQKLISSPTAVKILMKNVVLIANTLDKFPKIKKLIMHR